MKGLWYMLGMFSYKIRSIRFMSVLRAVTTGPILFQTSCPPYVLTSMQLVASDLFTLTEIKAKEEGVFGTVYSLQ